MRNSSVRATTFHTDVRQDGASAAHESINGRTAVVTQAKPVDRTPGRTENGGHGLPWNLLAFVLICASAQTHAQVTSTFAGGYSGDGGSAINGALNLPYGMTVDASVNLYIADYANNRIRKVDTTGTIMTVAGNGIAGKFGDGKVATGQTLTQPQGVAVDAAANLYIADSGTSRIRKVDINGIISTFAGNGQFGFSGDGGIHCRYHQQPHPQSG